MIQNNKTRSYLLYAVGEVFLVVIGILIAVSIDDWNEERKQKQVEKKYFQNLKNDLLADIERLDLMINLSDSKVKAAQRVKIKTDKDSIGTLYGFSEDMVTLIFVDEFRPNQNTYDEMKSSGNFSTIKNDELKLKFVNLKKAYINIEASQEHMRNDFNVFLEDFQKYINWGKYYDLNKSNIPEVHMVYDSAYIQSHQDEMAMEVHDLFKNKVFLNNIFLLEVNYTYLINVLNNTKAQIKEIIDLLDQEIIKE